MLNDNVQTIATFTSTAMIAHPINIKLTITDNQLTITNIQSLILLLFRKQFH